MKKVVQLTEPKQPQGVWVGHYKHPDDFEVFFGKEDKTGELFLTVYIPSQNKRIYQGKDDIYSFYKVFCNMKRTRATIALPEDIIAYMRVFEFDKKLAEAEEDDL